MVADEQIRRGVAYEERLMFHEAASCYTEVLKLDPANAIALARLGFVLYNMRRLDEAVACLNKSLAKNPFYDEPHICLGMIARERGLFDDALGHFSKALNLNPGSSWILTNIGATLQHMGRYEDGVACLRRAYEENVSLQSRRAQFDQIFGEVSFPVANADNALPGSSKKILIVVSAFNRQKITGLSLWQTARFKKSSCFLQVYNDHSSEYDNAFLAQYADEVIRLPRKMGIDALRWHQFRAFLETEYEYLYLTDNDVIHDPAFITMLDVLYEKGGRRMPVSLFHNVIMLQPRLILYYGGGMFVKTSAPGASMFFDRAMVEKILTTHDRLGDSLGPMPWDNKAVACLGLPWISPEHSYVEHFGAGGLNSDNYERERAVNPTAYLRAKRESIIRYLTGEVCVPPPL